MGEFVEDLGQRVPDVRVADGVLEDVPVGIPELREI